MQKVRKGFRFRFLIAAIALACCAFAASILVACNNEEPVPPPEAGAEAGVYYYDASAGSEYLLTLGEGCTFTFITDDEVKNGSYSLEGSELTLSAGDWTQTAALDGNVITLEYENAQMRFLKKVYFTVSFDAAGGSEVTSVSVLNGKTLEKPAADPTYGGHVFLGWYTDAEYASPFLFGSQAVTGNLTLHARWAEESDGEEYTVSYDLGYDGERIPDAETIGGKLYNAAVPAARSGYTFVGWWVSTEDDAARLSYRFEEPTGNTEGTVFNADTTLFAVWQEDGAVCNDPAVSLSQQSVRWDSVGAAAYIVSFIAPDGTRIIDSRRETSTTIPVTMDEAGVYRAEVTAIDANGNTLSQKVERYFVNNGLARVSGLRVIEPNALVFRGVEHAEKYLITIDCGNPAHNHDAFDNGTSLYYNFANCDMQPGGIVFTVTAVADGYASSEATIVFERNLDKISSLTVKDDMVRWSPVEGATSYLVTVGGESYSVFGTEFSLKEFEEGSCTVTVTPAATGFTTPAAGSVESATTTPALPDGLRLNGTLLSWDAVNGAVYNILVDGEAINDQPLEQPSFELDGTFFTWTEGARYSLQLQVVKGSAEALSEEFVFYYNAIGETPAYDNNVLYWNPVAGADRYEISLNGQTVATVDNGESFYVFDSLGTEGKNVLGVRFVSGGYVSEWAETEVTAHSVTFDSRGGNATTTLYKAVGDEIALPQASLKTGYDFVAWYNTPNGPASNGASFTDKFFVSSGELVLYAYYSPKAYTVLYSGADGLEKTSVYYGQNYTLDVPDTADGTTAFGGWFSAPYGAGIAYTDAHGNSLAPWDLAEDNITVYAFWVESVLDYTYMPTAGGYTVTAGDRIGLVNSVTVPEEYNGEKVTGVAGSAFANRSNLTEINLPDTIRTLTPETAFAGCSALEAVNFYSTGEALPRFTSEDGVIFDHGQDGQGTPTPAFMPAAKTGSYTIPDGVQIIPRAAFAGSKLDKIVIPASVTAIEAEAFANCESLVSVVFENAGAGSPSLTIGNRAFMNCTALTSITLPARLTDISLQKYALNGSFDDIDEITENAPDAFLGCTSLSSINVSKGSSSAAYVSEDGVLLSDSGRTLAYFPAEKRADDYTVPASVRTIGSGAFLGCSITGTLTVPASIVNVGSFAFADCPLEAIVFEGGGLSGCTVGDYAFYGCDSVETLTFAEDCSVTTIGDYAFSGLAIGEVTIPARVTSIGDYAFEDCMGGYYGDEFEVTFAMEGACNFGDGVFSGSGLSSLTIPKNAVVSSGFLLGLDKYIDITVEEGNATLTSDGDAIYLKSADGQNAYETLFIYQGEATEYTVRDGVKIIADNVFNGNYDLEKVTIPGTVTSIGSYAFAEGYLSELYFEAGGTETLTIGDYAFYYSRIATMHLPTDRDVVIGDYAFAEISDSSYLTDVDLGGTTEIGDYAFAGSGNYSSFTIPASVKSIGNYAFEGGYSSRAVTFTFAGDSSLETIGAFAFTGRKIESITIPASVTSIGACAFEDCDDLTSITFEDGEAPLVFGAAYGSYTGNVLNGTLVEKVDFPARLTVLSDQAFYYNDSTTEVTFPENSRLTTIGAEAFKYGNLQKIKLPASLNNTDVIAVGNEAFSGAPLTEFSFMTGGTGEVTLGESALAFSYNSTITEITLPKTLAPFTAGGTTIPALANGADVFSDALESISVEEGCSDYASDGGMLYSADYSRLILCPTAKSGKVTVHAQTEVIGSNAFSGCRYITEIEFPAGSALTTIEDRAFANCGVIPEPDTEEGFTDLVLPDGVTSIGADAFMNCPIVSLTLPASFDDFDSAMLNNCNTLTSLNVAEGNKTYASKDGVLFTADGETLLYYLPTRTDTAYTVPDGTITIAASAFSDNTSLESVTIPASVGNIEANAFSNCSSLAEVTIGEGDTVLVIGDYAFSSTAIETLDLPSRTTAIGNNAFSRSLLTSLAFGDNSGLTSIGESAFEGTLIEDITLPAGLRSLGELAFSNCSALTRVTLSEGLTSIGDSVFSGCSALETVSLPASLNTVGTMLFANCTSLKNVIFADNSQIRTLPVNTFYGCSALESITLPASLTEIPGKTEAGSTPTSDNRGLFQGLTSLRSVTFGEGSLCVSIGISAFEDSGLESIQLPASVASIENSAFAGTSLTQITIPRTVTRLGGYAFNNCTLLETVRLGEGLTELPSNIFGNCRSLAEITIPASVSVIAEDAFSGCINLKNITLAGGNTAFTLIDGVLYDSEITQIYFMPHDITEYEIPATLTTETVVSLLRERTQLQTVTVEEGNTAYHAAFGALYSADRTLLLIPAAMTKFTVAADAAAIDAALLIGSSVETIYVEEGCKNFKESGGILYTADLELLYIPAAVTEFVVPEDMQRIDTDMLANSNIEKISVEEGNTSFHAKNDILYDAQWKVLFIPSTAKNVVLAAETTSVSTYLLEDLDIETISVEEGGTTYSSAFNVLYDKYDDIYFIPASLTTYTIPKDLTTLGYSSALNYSNVTTIDFEEGGTEPLTIEGDFIEDNDTIQTVHIPARAVLERYAFYNRSSLRTVILEDGLTEIGAQAFYYCTGIESITIPSTVTTIGSNAFYGWSESQTIYVPFASADDLPAGWDSSWSGNATVVYSGQTQG